jgi:hypothetical protein
MANDNNVFQALLAQQAAMLGNGAPDRGILGILRDANCGTGLSATVCGIGAKPIVQFGGTGNPNGLFSKLMRGLGLNPEELAKGLQQVAQGAGAMYAGDVLNQNATHGLGSIGRGGNIEIS